MVESPDEILVETASDLEELVARLRACDRFAFDTEFVSEESFEPVLCLIQVAAPGLLAVVDPLAIDDLAPFWAVLDDPGVEPVLHAAGEDLRICRLRTGTVPRRVFDVQIAAGLVGFGYPLSLGNLVGQALGVAVPGGETRADWRRRPLGAAQLRYALDDVRYLLDLADVLGARLAHLGRTAWAEAEFAQLVAMVRDRVEEERWRRLPGLHQLNRRGLEIARRLAEWRFDAARRANRPFRQVLRDDLVVALARRQPAHRRDLESLRDFDRPHLRSKVGEILAIIAQARDVPPEQLPEPVERPEDRPGLAMAVNLLAATLARCCAEHQVALGLVGATQDLKDLIRWQVDGRPVTRRPALALGWRDEVCGRTLLDVLDGRLALRLVDPLADVPIALEPVGGAAPVPAVASSQRMDQPSQPPDAGIENQ
jgi:ribonuclease D